MDLHLRCTIGVERDLPLVPHFIRYYRMLGVQHYLFVLHAREASSPNLAKARGLLQDFGIEPAAIWVTRSWQTGDNAQHHRQVIEELSEDSWIITADIDEFHEYPKPLRSFIEDISAGGWEVVRGRLVQRVTRAFRLVPLRADTNIFTQFPVEADFGIGNPGKIMLHRKYIRTTPGHHYFESFAKDSVRVYPQILKVAHFKWFEGVGQKYVVPSIMAHHSEVWEFGAYDKFIQRNFFGWRRWINVFKFHRFVQPGRRAVSSARRTIGNLSRGLRNR